MLNIKLLPEMMLTPEDQQDRFKENLFDFIEETFVFTADEDYVTARMLALTGMHRMFYWSASQALEKYFKALLLQQGFSVNSYSHNLYKIFSSNSDVFNFLNDVDLGLPNKVKEKYDELGFLELFGSVEIFIKHVEEYGSTDNRYNQIGIGYETTALILLDRVVWMLQTKIARSEIMESRVRKMDEHIVVFLKKNHEFFEPYEPPIIQLHNRVTKLERILKGCYGFQNIYEKWLKENIKIYDNNIKYLKQK